jgi:hypothetical protein
MQIINERAIKNQASPRRPRAIRLKGTEPTLFPIATTDSERGQILSPVEAQAELEAVHRRELHKLSDLAFIFLTAAGGDSVAAERLLDDFIDLVFEGGVLSTWRYRILLAAIRKGP